MQQSDLDGIIKRDVAARQAGASCYDNPCYFASGSLEEWSECCQAWSAGWIKEDAGRDQVLARRLWEKSW